MDFLTELRCIGSSHFAITGHRYSSGMGRITISMALGRNPTRFVNSRQPHFCRRCRTCARDLTFIRCIDKLSILLFIIQDHNIRPSPFDASILAYSSSSTPSSSRSLAPLRIIGFSLPISRFDVSWPISHATNRTSNCIG
jgi:hypothetical protein